MSQALTKKEKTHQRMLEAASKSFRKNGFAGIGVDGIAKAAEVTSGAFYAHFGSKDGAFRAALNVGLGEVVDAVPVFQRDFGEEWVVAFAEYYLGEDHIIDLSSGCAMTTLTPEVVRASDEVQEIYEDKMVTIAALMTKGLQGDTQEDRTSRAWAFLAILIGGLNVVRAMSSKTEVEKITTSVISTAIVVAGPTRKV